MYKEFRDVTLNGAVQKLYTEMAGKHRTRKTAIQIIRTAVVKAADVRRTHVKQFLDGNINFRLLHRVPRASSKKFSKTFSAKRPSTRF